MRGHECNATTRSLARIATGSSRARARARARARSAAFRGTWRLPGEATGAAKVAIHSTVAAAVSARNQVPRPRCLTISPHNHSESRRSMRDRLLGRWPGARREGPEAGACRSSRRAQRADEATTAGWWPSEGASRGERRAPVFGLRASLWASVLRPRTASRPGRTSARWPSSMTSDRFPYRGSGQSFGIVSDGM